jgi:hypothetical protein
MNAFCRDIENVNQGFRNLARSLSEKYRLRNVAILRKLNPGIIPSLIVLEVTTYDQ